MVYKGRCPICKKIKPLTRHHVYKKAVFGDNDSIVLVCRQCHDRIEEVIRDKENALLIEHPDIYMDTWIDFKRGMYYDLCANK